MDTALLGTLAPRRDDPEDFFMTHYMHDNQEDLGLCVTNGGIPHFVNLLHLRPRTGQRKLRIYFKGGHHASKLPLCLCPTEQTPFRMERERRAHSVLTSAIRGKPRERHGEADESWRSGAYGAFGLSD
jgi:hypothetical protein